VILAGLGLLTPLGAGAWATFRALLAGRTVTDRARHLPPDVGPVDLVRALGVVPCAQQGGADPAVELAERAAREAAAEAGVPLAGLPAFVGTSKGAAGISDFGLIADRTGQPKISNQQSAVSKPPFPGPHAYLNHHLARRTGISIRAHHVAACASSLVALDHARRFLVHPRRQEFIPPAPPAHALVVTAEASLTPLFIHSYRRLGVLAPLTRDGYRERPFDQRRNGFILAEAGAAVVLQRIEPDQPLPPGSIELVDTATACEAHDLIRPNPDMLALRHIARRMFAQCGDQLPGPAVHAHAPGTPDHDPAELTAYHDLLPPLAPGFARGPAARDGDHPRAEPGANGDGPTGASAMPPIYASKGALGHTLGASGLVSLIIAALSTRTQKLPPMPWLTDPISPHLLTIKHELPPPTPHAVFAAGFAGHTAGALIRRTT